MSPLAGEHYHPWSDGSAKPPTIRPHAEQNRAALDRLREAAADLLHTLYEAQGQ